MAISIGLTGNIACGKSRVARYLCGRDSFLCLDADEICRQLLDRGMAGWQALRNAFGNYFFDKDGFLLRQKLREALFADANLRLQVDQLIHPLVRQRINAFVKEQHFRQVVVVAEVPLLFEVGWQSDFDKTIVVKADNAQCLNRIMARDGVSKEQAQKAFNSQMPLLDKVKKADIVIDNSGNWSETCRQIDEFAQGCLILLQDQGKKS